MTDHYRDQVTDLCEWLRDEKTARNLVVLSRDSSPATIKLIHGMLAGKADQIDPAIQLEAPRRKDKPE
jgi:hypothetical protein